MIIVTIGIFGCANYQSFYIRTNMRAYLYTIHTANHVGIQTQQSPEAPVVGRVARPSGDRDSNLPTRTITAGKTDALTSRPPNPTDNDDNAVKYVHVLHTFLAACKGVSVIRNLH